MIPSKRILEIISTNEVREIDNPDHFSLKDIVFGIIKYLNEERAQSTPAEGGGVQAAPEEFRDEDRRLS